MSSLAPIPIPYQDVSFMTIFWIILVLLVVVTNIADIAMKLEINGELPPEEKFSWWSRNYWGVERRYREFHPESYLPSVARWSFWLFVALFAMWGIASATGRLD
jgi:hypothetical protein